MLKKRRQKKKQKIACIYITCTLKNTLITVTDLQRQTISQYSSRSYPDKVKRKNNPYILQQISNQITKQLISMRYNRVFILLKGVGLGRYHILKHVRKKIKILRVHDKTNTPFNGCRLQKPKRK